MALKGANTGLRRFQHTTRWRINIDLRNSQHKRIPVELDLHLALGRQTLEDQWSVMVTLNERLLHQDLLDQSATHLEKRVSLPGDFVTATNVIEVTVTSTRQNDDHCNRPLELIAEMLPETTLIEGDATFSDALTILQAQLSAMGVLRIGALSNLSATDADVASDLLAQILPVDVNLKPKDEKADILVVTPNDATLTLPDAGVMWFVSLDTVTRKLVVDHLTPQHHIATQRGGPLDHFRWCRFC